MQPAVLSSGVLLGVVLLLTHINKAESNPFEKENMIERNPGPKIVKTMPKFIPDGPRRPSREELMNSVDDEGGMRLRNPYLVELLENLEQDLMARKELLENSKRGLDLGLSRGFSGSQAAKHLMGLAAANFAGGPGRKRRSLTYVS